MHSDFSRWLRLAGLVLALALVPGCVFPRWKAASVLTLADPAVDTTAPMGFPRAVWAPEDGQLVVAAEGTFPRDHETYIVFWVEPFPAFMPRYVLLRGPNDVGMYDLTLYISNNLGEQVGIRRREGGFMHRFEGVVPASALRLRREARWRLDGIKVHHAEDAAALRLSGRLVAKPGTPRDIAAVMESLRLSLAPPVEQDSSQPPMPPATHPDVP